MDRKKALFVIIVSAILAFAVAFVLKPKQLNTMTTSSVINPPVTSEEIFENSTEKLSEQAIEPVTSQKENKALTSASVSKDKEKITITDLKKEDQTPFFEKLQVQEEVTKVEEAGVSFDDPGIINENGVIVVTRDFKIKSPRKYSFKSFGVLAEPPVR